MHRKCFENSLFTSFIEEPLDILILMGQLVIFALISVLFSLLLRLPGQVLGEAREGYSSSPPPASAPSPASHAHTDASRPASGAVVRLGKTLKKKYIG